MKIAFNDELLTGVDVIDEQHKELFRRINALLNACMERAGSEIVKDTLAFLRSYAVKHFSMEEAVMRRAQYAGFEHHAALHREFRKRIEDLAAEIDQTGVGPQTVVRVNQLLVDWLNAHIRKVDRAMAIKLRESFTSGRHA